jgi:hypothetical protein
MSDAGYVIGGWALTAAALVGYYARLVVRTRYASRSGEHR